MRYLFSCNRYNKAVHKAQGVVESTLGSTTIKKGRGKVADDNDALPPASDAESDPEDDGDDVSKFQKKPRGKAAAAGGAGAAGGAKRKAGGATAATGKTKAAPAKKRRA